MAKGDKACMLEQYGVAVNASSLKIGRLPGERETERSLDRVAAMGMASLSMRLGDQSMPTVLFRVGHVLPPKVSLTVAASAYRPQGNRQDAIVADLAPMLVRMKAGGQVQLIGQAVQLFARYCSVRPRFEQAVGGEACYPRLMPFASAVLHEWLHERCGRCGGSGRLQITDRGAVRTLGSNARNGRFVRCSVCHGTGQALGRDAQRAHIMGLNLKVYELAGWSGQFAVARAWLTQLCRRPNKHLQRELER